ncbi:MAG: outer membrane protein assembly factor BamA [Bacteroidales bacterium]|nr:outer membrane protein assembly factor BamA [Bacteroidales bacterium]
MYKFQFVFLFFLINFSGYSQQTDVSNLSVIDYSRPKDYEIAEIEVTGIKYLQPRVLRNISGLNVGQKITVPGDEISSAINKYWEYGLFSDVKIIATKIEEGKIYLEIALTEQPRISQVFYEGINKSDADNLKEKVKLKQGSQITDNILSTTIHIIKTHFIEKGFLNTEVNIVQKDDTASVNRVNLFVHIDKNKRVKIEEIDFEGNEDFSDKRLRRVLKKTKQRDINIFKGSKYKEKDYKEDLDKLIAFYNENGYRDAKILDENLYTINNKRIGLKISLEEGKPYYIRSISWIGNTKYPASALNSQLGLKKGDVYNQTLIEERLQTDEDAISSFYMDQGYLFFSIVPVEAKVEGDSIDLEMQIYEGKQATINDVIIKGNTKTNEHVVRRELRTRPGELFSRSDIIRSVRELSALGHFNPEAIFPNPIPNQADGTVDLEYQLEERPNDQLEVSGGWGGVGFVGTIGIRFSNFSARNIFEKKAWRPVPSGDGQTLQVRAQSNAQYYQAYSISFIEPWFGGKKPNSFSVSLYHTVRGYPNTSYYSAYRNSHFKTYGLSVGLGRRLTWPDDFFTLSHELSFQRYNLSEYGAEFVFSTGVSNLISLRNTLTRSSQDQMIYPRRGSNITFGLQLTPPYSLFNNKDYSTMTPQEKYKFIEFHKWTFNATHYTSLAGNLVMATRAEFGYLGHYNKKIGPSPFEKYRVGGSGMVGYSLYGTDIVALRGYDDGTLTPQYYNAETGSYVENGNIYTRYFMELRYPITLNPSATIYGLGFIEGGNAWSYFNEFNPFEIKRSAGVGIRAFLPMFGLLGIDWAYGFDKQPGEASPHHGSQFHFIMGQQF